MLTDGTTGLHGHVRRREPRCFPPAGGNRVCGAGTGLVTAWRSRDPDAETGGPGSVLASMPPDARPKTGPGRPVSTPPPATRHVALGTLFVSRRTLKELAERSAPTAPAEMVPGHGRRCPPLPHLYPRQRMLVTESALSHFRCTQHTMGQAEHLQTARQRCDAREGQTRTPAFRRGFPPQEGWQHSRASKPVHSAQKMQGCSPRSH